MCNAFQELLELSLEVQDRNINIYKAYVKVRALVQIPRKLLRRYSR